MNEVDIRDLADVAAAALTSSRHDNEIHSLTGPDALGLPPRSFDEFARDYAPLFA